MSIFIIIISFIILTVYLLHHFYFSVHYQNLQKYDNKKIAIIGAGFCGILCGISLKKMKINNFVIYEQYHQIGGCWAKSKYPGCACDVKSHLYSYSFNLNPFWNRRFPLQQSIQKYLENTAIKYGIIDHIKLNHNVEQLKYLKNEQKWSLKFKNQEKSQVQEEKYNIVFNASGLLNTPKYPKFADTEEKRNIFQGKLIHSANYDVNYKFEGKKVAVIGTSATSVQLSPIVSKQSKEFYIFQSSPNFMVQKPDGEYSQTFQFLCQYIPGFIRLYRWILFFTYEHFYLFQRYDFFNKIAEKMLLKKQIELSHGLQEDVQKASIPTYQFGTQKPCLTSDYFDMLRQKNSNLIYEPITTLLKNGVELKSGKTVDLDCIIFATGYEWFDIAYPIIGQKGQTLNQQWKSQGAQAYKGSSVPNFPNLVILSGPNTVLSNNSQVFTIESQQAYVNKLISHIYKNQINFFDVKQKVFDDYQKEMKQKTDKLTFGKCQLKSQIIYGGCASHFWFRVKNLNTNDYVFSQ